MSTAIHEPFSKTPPSDIFIDAVVCSGHIVADCEFCGRTFFEDDEKAGDWDLGELAKLREDAVREPNRVIAMNTTVRAGVINGKTGIAGCPCNWGKPYEDLIWGHRRFIMGFISAKVKDMVERALEDEGSAEQATADLAQADKAEKTVRCPRCLKFVSEIAMNEGGICVRCWEQVEKEAKEETERERRANQEAEEAKKNNSPEDLDSDNLPF